MPGRGARGAGAGWGRGVQARGGGRRGGGCRCGVQGAVGRCGVEGLWAGPAPRVAMSLGALQGGAGWCWALGGGGRASCRAACCW